MTNSEYQELVGFLGRKFDEVDGKLEGMATKEELRTHEANIRRHFDVMAEGLRGRCKFLRRATRRLWKGRSGY